MSNANNDGTHHHCFGCGKQLGEIGYWDNRQIDVELFGEKRTICTARRTDEAKKSCVDKAVKRLMADDICPACGAERQRAYNHYDTALCEECSSLLDEAREQRDKQASLQTEALAKVVHSIANHKGHGESLSDWQKVYPSWPFTLLTNNSSNAQALMSALRQMWEASVEVAHKAGVREGTDLVAGLKMGRVSVGDYDDRIGAVYEDYRKKIQEFEQHCTDAVEAALKLEE